MRQDLQAQLLGPVGTSNYPVSAGHQLENKLLVKAWLYMMKFAPNINFNIPTIQGKIAGLQGLTDTNMMDLEIQGLATQLGYGNYTWAQLKPVAAAAINGQGIQQTGVQSQTAVVGTQDFLTLINYALLTNAKILNDAS